MYNGFQVTFWSDFKPHIILQFVSKASQEATTSETFHESGLIPIEMAKETKTLNSDYGNMLEPWMLSMDDVQFDPSNLNSIIGQDTVGTVFKGSYHGEAVAVKQFHSINQVDSVELEELIANEIKVWAKISHEPYILTLIGLCKVPRPILVTELCQTNIRRYVRDWSETLLPMVYQFAKGLATIHNANVIHRDLKGDNVLVTAQKTVAIADFGLSRDGNATMMDDDQVRGTLNWMSPEQYFKPQSVTTKSDISSFGMTLWEILNNETPYRECSEYEFKDIFQSDDDRPEKPQEVAPMLEPLWSLITKCWQLDPHARPSAVEIVAFFEDHYNSQL
ncbi:hypothetical protein AeMF1_019264 [Aphanomyces euteiches]|nr:hypothetical protein AeMF1_019264 [Aphanomyces euteiches]KAH9188588.1 hypothetical protein AeNC1_009435 [Aphanomyces euteiches]